MKSTFSRRSRTTLFRTRSQRSKSLHVETLEPRVVLSGTPIISEFLASNDRSIEDQDGDDSDWIEIYNAGQGTVNLFGWSLTDSSGNLTKWRCCQQID